MLSHKQNEANWLYMNNRFRLYSLRFCHKIIGSGKKPLYLYNHTHKTDVHDINVRKKA